MDVYKIKIYPTAKQDLREIIDYLNTLSQQAALRYYDLLIAEIESLSQMPFRCPKPRDIALRQTDLQNAEAEQNQTDGANQGKDEIAQVIHDRQRIAVCRERRDNKNRQHEKHAGEDGIEPLGFGFKRFLQ